MANSRPGPDNTLRLTAFLSLNAANTDHKKSCDWSSRALLLEMLRPDPVVMATRSPYCSTIARTGARTMELSGKSKFTTCLQCACRWPSTRSCVTGTNKVGSGLKHKRIGMGDIPSNRIIGVTIDIFFLRLSILEPPRVINP